jgi:hypothetical protein
LGGLIGVVSIFFIVSSIIDRKKRKKEKIEHVKMVEKSNTAAGKVSIYINLVIKKNKIALQRFIPSIGKIKMKDINHSARKALKNLTHKEFYSDLLASDEFVKDISRNLKNLIKEKSNN